MDWSLRERRNPTPLSHTLFLRTISRMEFVGLTWLSKKLHDKLTTCKRKKQFSTLVWTAVVFLLFWSHINTIFAVMSDRGKRRINQYRRWGIFFHSFQFLLLKLIQKIRDIHPFNKKETHLDVWNLIGWTKLLKNTFVSRKGILDLALKLIRQCYNYLLYRFVRSNHHL